MWAHRPWIGRFYPAGLKPGTELSQYATWCNAVEGNTTFYAQPAPATIERWSAQAPSGFRFAFKLPKTITHEKRLRDVAVEVRSFLDAIEPLGERIGPIQIQLPASFGPDDLDVLLAFTRRLPADHTWALELRHTGFFDGSTTHRCIDDDCNARNISRVVLDTRPLYSVAPVSEAAVDEQRKKPSLPVVLDAVGATPIVRVIGEDSVQGTLDGLLTWVPQLASWIEEGREPYLFVHQPENLESPGLARAVHEAVFNLVAGLAPLPDPAGQQPMF